MNESKATKEETTEEKKDEIKSAKAGEFGVIAELTQEAERVISEASEAAGREARQELERILAEYERKTKQIVLKIREETKAKTADIAGRLSETIMQRIEQASSKAVSEAASEFNIRAIELSRNVEVETSTEISPPVAEAPAIPENGAAGKDNETRQQDVDKAEAKVDNNGHKNESVTEEEGIELKQPLAVDDFDQWLTQ
ncbi:hypothetical protein ACFLYS_03700 [Chloroflexota bacterium]